MSRSFLTLAILVVGCGRTPFELDGGAASDAGLTIDAGPGCVTEFHDVPRVRFDFPAQPCRFTLAQAAAGVSFRYAVTVDPLDAAFLESLPPGAQTCASPRPGLGLYVFERISGQNGKGYCLCDQGNCQPSLPLQGPTPGRSTFAFAWEGREWYGPSDTGTQPGAPLPVGDYTFRIESTVSDVRTDAGATVLTGQFFFTVTP